MSDRVLRDAAILLRHGHAPDVLLQALNVEALDLLEEEVRRERMRRWTEEIVERIGQGGVTVCGASMVIHRVASAKGVRGLTRELAGCADETQAICGSRLRGAWLRPDLQITCERCVQRSA